MTEDQQPEITRHGVWPILKYNVRRPRHSNASVFIDDRTGMIVVDTDFGQQDTYSHWWGPQGRGTGTLREFLVGVSGTSYLKDKFSYGKERWNVDKAENDVREALKDKNLNEIDEADVEDFFGEFGSNVTQNEWGARAMDNEILMRELGFEWFVEHQPGHTYDNPDAAKMVDKVLMPLIEFWKEELKNESPQDVSKTDPR